MSDEDTNRLATFIRNETMSIERSTKRLVAVGVFFVVVIAGYMGFVLYMVKSFLEPQTLAIVVGNQVGETLPSVIDSAEQNLKEAAPVIANQVSSSFLETIPEIAESGKREIDIAYKEKIPFISQEFKLIVREYIEENSEELVAFAEDHSDEEFAQHFTAQMMNELGVQLERRLTEAYGRTDNLKYFSDNLTYSLLAMNATLDGFLDKDVSNLSRQERLQRRILARLVQSVHESAPE